MGADHKRQTKGLILNGNMKLDRYDGGLQTEISSDRIGEQVAVIGAIWGAKPQAARATRLARGGILG